MHNLDSFSRLSKGEKLNILDEYAIFLNKWRTDVFEIRLYRLSDFYAEVYYDTQSFNINEVRSFRSTDHDRKYAAIVNEYLFEKDFD